MKTCLVTGAAGFIGSHLCDHLLRAGHAVIGIDDLSSGAATPADRPHFQFIRRAIDEDFRFDFGQRAGPNVDVIFHLAAMVGVRVAIERGAEVMKRNAAATVGICAFARERMHWSQSPLTVVIASSSEVYGDTDTQPLNESMPSRIPPPVSLRHGYTLEKAAAEYHLMALAAETGCTAIAARLFNTVGPGQNKAYGAVVPTMAAAAIAGKPIPVHIDASGYTTTRSFIHVMDTAAALAHLAEHGDTRTVYNVGLGEEVTMRELADVVWQAAGRPEPTVVEYIPVGGDVRGCRRRVPDTGRLTATGFIPARTWVEAVAAVVGKMRSEEEQQRGAFSTEVGT